MRILFILLLSLLSNITYADGLAYSHLVLSDDSDNNKLWYEELGFWYVKDSSMDIGSSIRHTRFKNDNSTRLALLVDKRFEKYGTNVDIGVDSLDNTITGKVGLSRWLDYGSINLNLERGLVDSLRGIEDDITFDMGYVQTEFSYRNNSIVGILGSSLYSDGGKNDWYRLIGVVPLNKNFNLMGQYRDMSFSDDSVYYFSPREYSRLLYGISTYHDIADNFYIRSKLLYGHQEVSGNRRNSYLINVVLNYSMDSYPLDFNIDLLSDSKQPEYSYERIMFNIVYRF